MSAPLNHQTEVPHQPVERCADCGKCRSQWKSKAQYIPADYPRYRLNYRFADGRLNVRICGGCIREFRRLRSATNLTDGTVHHPKSQQTHNDFNLNQNRSNIIAGPSFMPHPFRPLGLHHQAHQHVLNHILQPNLNHLNHPPSLLKPVVNSLLDVPGAGRVAPSHQATADKENRTLGPSMYHNTLNQSHSRAPPAIHHHARNYGSFIHSHTHSSSSAAVARVLGQTLPPNAVEDMDIDDDRENACASPNLQQLDHGSSMGNDAHSDLNGSSANPTSMLSVHSNIHGANVFGHSQAVMNGYNSHIVNNIILQHPIHHSLNNQHHKQLNEPSFIRSVPTSPQLSAHHHSCLIHHRNCQPLHHD